MFSGALVVGLRGAVDRTHILVMVPEVEVSRAVLGFLPHGSEIKLQWVAPGVWCVG